MKTQLPEFSSPPLSEVALSVQFEPLDRLVVPEIGLLWQHYGKRFTHVEQHGPLDAIIERTGVRRSRTNVPNIQIAPGVPLPRIWFLDDSKRTILQIQQDRFTRNWRQMDFADEYPRYEESIRPSFIEDLQDFIKFMSDKEIGTISPTQCEVVYINYIRPNECWDTHADADKVFSFVANSVNVSETQDLKLEDAKLEIRHLINDEEGHFLGRLYVLVTPVFERNEDIPMFELRLVARGRPLSSTIEGVMGFLDLGRNHIVRTFEKVTTECLHGVWGKKESREV